MHYSSQQPKHCSTQWLEPKELVFDWSRNKISERILIIIIITTMAANMNSSLLGAYNNITTNAQETFTDNTSSISSDQIDMVAATGFVGLEQDATNTKLLAALVLFVTTLICGYAPVRFILNQRYIQYAVYTGGGVLMATAFCHLIPETHDNYRDAMQLAATNTASSQNSTPTDQPQPMSHTLPIPEIVLCFGFFFMYIVELLMMRFINNRTHEHPCDTGLGQLDSSANTATDQCGTGVHGDPRPIYIQPVESNICSSEATLNFSTSSLSANSNATRTEFYKFLRGLLIVSAFVVHSIFDGVAIGSQESVSSVWTVFIAISCHKLIIAAVVGLELFTATLESHLWTLVHLFLFSAMSPIGILLIVLAQNSLQLSEADPVMILLQCFATGTLIYIVFIEILQPKEGQTQEKNKFGKSLSLVAGFVLMLMALTLIGE